MDLEKNESKEKQKEEETQQKIGTFLARYFNWLLVFVVLALIVAGGFFILKPKYDYVVKLTKDNASGTEQEYSTRREYLGKIKSLIEAYDRVNAADIKKVNFILAEKDVLEGLFPQIESLTKKNGLLLGSLKIESAEGAKESPGIDLTKKIEDTASLSAEIEKVKVSLSVVGVDYFSLKSFISALENNLTLIDIVNLNFSPDAGSAEFVFYTYYLKKTN